MAYPIMGDRLEVQGTSNYLLISIHASYKPGEAHDIDDLRIIPWIRTSWDFK